MIVAVDLFAGGGGASEGIRRAIGRAPIVAVNHCPHAIEMHARNHPNTIHLQESVHDVEPLDHVRGQRVDLLWASPDCRHHSRAKGGRPLKKDIRGLAWVVVRWARVVAPEVICLENVREFEDWGPLYPEEHPDPKLRSRPIPERKGETFQKFVGALRGAGYQVEWRVLNAADYGAPTSRERLVLIARRGFTPIVWPEPTHGPGRPKPYRTAAECIDWSIPSCSIFATPDEAKAWREQWKHVEGVDGTPKRPLAAATMRRIAEGLRRFVLEAPDPFIVATGHQSSDAGKVRSAHEPLSTVVTKAEHLVCTPYVMPNNTNNVPRAIGEPVPTITTGWRNYLIAPALVNTRNGEREGQRPRVRGLDQPAPTVTAQGSQGALMSAFLEKFHGSARAGQVVGAPAPTITSGGGRGGGHAGLVSAFLAKHYGGPNGKQAPGADLRGPLGTITSRDSQGPVLAPLAAVGQDMGRAAAVAAFLVKFYGQGGQHQAVGEPLHTIVTKARFGLVTVDIGGEEYVVTDIAMRMLQPRELARAQGVSDDYVLTGTKAQQTARIGNMVCPDMAEAVVRAQFGLEPRREAA